MDVRRIAEQNTDRRPGLSWPPTASGDTHGGPRLSSGQDDAGATPDIDTDVPPPERLGVNLGRTLLSGRRLVLVAALCLWPPGL